MCDSTVQLPPPQNDNSGSNVDHTRPLHSRSRANIQAAIAAIIQPPQNLQPKKVPQSQTQAKQWPVDAGSKPATTAPPAHQEHSQAEISPEKKKRTRTRKRKTEPSTPLSDEQRRPTPTEDSTELRLR